MNSKIRIGIVGYGNLGRGAELAISQNQDMELVAIFTRRKPDSLDTKSNVVHISNMLDFKNKIDVMLLCGGSAKDLGEQVPMTSQYFNTVDSFDNHKKIPEYFEQVNNIAKKSNKLSLISVGWDPGLFSLIRLLGETILPDGTNYTFWGKGISQGHSDAIRKIKGVKDGVQYTVPSEEILKKVKNFENLNISPCKMHKRICYVVCKDGEDLSRIENEIKTMPNYFADYDTTVNFISEEELKRNHSKMPHGGFVIRTGTTKSNAKHKIEFNLSLDSNPEFTSSILVAYARAVNKMALEGKTGAITIFDIPLVYLSPKTGEQLRRELL
ncbi:diaminopimelate dehydrogenase [Tepidimicrobium xylanilyticum]|uniref:Meso-diaminopimelate D-dehydrogenase n=1 Tax=Tepidimicrobium xylanilyticum TaxID=1123352 RepID=A0A1H3C152_9FIRM|nr:diaminopimelate dehydrogenase [Tepidimicrobium xylanilyticum]GMG97317.1 diaminopimelate dehydrogenase [Tepidimicrobium xylanilyticum]SDX47810.1 diaminopimelate dehydrogenase [Tepidimicrobium xylanilyticum]